MRHQTVFVFACLSSCLVPISLRELSVKDAEVAVFVANRQLLAGEALRPPESAFTKVASPQTSVPENAISSIDELRGAFPNREMRKRSCVAKSDIRFAAECSAPALRAVNVQVDMTGIPLPYSQLRGVFVAITLHRHEDAPETVTVFIEDALILDTVRCFKNSSAILVFALYDEGLLLVNLTKDSGTLRMTLPK